MAGDREPGKLAEDPGRDLGCLALGVEFGSLAMSGDADRCRRWGAHCRIDADLDEGLLRCRVDVVGFGAPSVPPVLVDISLGRLLVRDVRSAGSWTGAWGVGF